MELAVVLVYQNSASPPLDRRTFVHLLQLAVEKMHFTCFGKWFPQDDASAMGSSFSVVLEILWMRTFEDYLGRETAPVNKNRPRDFWLFCGRCINNAENDSLSLCGDGCGLWFHQESIFDNVKTNAEDSTFWFCGCKVETTRRLNCLHVTSTTT